MKYKIIGWADIDDKGFEYRDGGDDYIENLIIEEIRKNGYRFGGDMHERYSPVLNDGTIVSYSWRGWGRVMATAWNEFEGGTDYMRYYMDMLVSDPVYPPSERVDVSKIKLRESLKETFTMHLAEGPFKAVSDGTKRVELRLNDPKRRQVCRGDYIEFVREGGDEKVKVRVLGVSTASSFKELFENINEKNPLAVPQAFGSPADTGWEEIAAGMRKYYSADEEQKYGVVAFEIEKIAHTCTTYIRIDSREVIDKAAFEYDLSEICSRWFLGSSGYVIGQNDNYDADINNMIRVTMGALSGSAKDFAALLKKHDLTAYLVMVVRIEAESALPAPMLSFERDVISFLYKSKILPDLDYYVYSGK